MQRPRRNRLLPFVTLPAMVGMMAGCTSTVVGPDTPPVAVAGPDVQLRLPGSTILDGSGSHDPDGGSIAEYAWELVAAPENAQLLWTRESGERVELAPDRAGAWLVRLRVSDGSLWSRPDHVLVIARARPCGQDSDCDDSEVCTADACVDGECSNDRIPDGTACDDGEWCTETDACEGGACTGTARDCSHVAAECTAGICDEALDACVSQPLDDGEPCEDGEYCTVDERCDQGSCGGGAVRDCSATGGGCVDGVCDEDQDACVGDPLPQGQACDDGLFCTVNDSCDGAGVCRGDPRDCSELATQCSDGACNESLAQCEAVPVAGRTCDDGVFCNGTDICDGSGGCSGHTGNPCSGGSECNRKCNEIPGNCYDDAGDACGATLDTACDNPDTCDGSGECLDNQEADGTSCDDLDVCTGAGSCQGGVCSPGVVDKDTDGDSYIDEGCTGGTDCDDGDSQIHPGMAENCTDGVDNDCDGDTDEADSECAGDWWNTQWHRRRKLIFDNSLQNEDLDDFPVLVVLNDPARVEYGFTRDQGQDMRFLDDGGATPLSHEIEDWNETGDSYVWVKVPRIDAWSATDFIWMYYDNDAAGDGQDREGVWTNRYQAVYHLHADESDSTSSNYHGTNHGSVQVAGVIANGRDFESASAHYIDLGNNRSFLRNVQGATLSAWIQPESIAFENYAISLSRYSTVPTSDSRATLGLVDYNKFVIGGRALDGDGYQRMWSFDNAASSGGLFHVVGILDYANQQFLLYIDGVHHRTLGNTLGTTTSDTNASYNTIGSQDDASQHHFDGMLDEVRISDTVRSAAWIRAQYLSMSDAGFVTYDPPEIQ